MGNQKRKKLIKFEFKFIKCWESVPFGTLIVLQTQELHEEFEDTKWVIRIRKSKDRQHNGQEKKDTRTTIYKAYLYTKLCQGHD
jgi:hypothetical protein